MKDKILSDKSFEIINAAYKKLKSIQAQKTEPIAVIGMACRFPQSNNIDSYWRTLLDNTDTMSITPPDRYDINLYHSGKPDDLISSPYGGYIEDVYDFDARFFDLSPKEALAMDPQQRVLLEVTIEALENANQPIDKLSKVTTSVYIGISSFDYGVRIQSNESLIDPYLGTGTLLSPAAGRISYFLNLTGPSMVIDTACSSSLVAIHQALTSLRIRESDISIVGGVGLLLEPNLHICFSKANMLSPNGKCKTFDDSANGYVRGEGCGVIILKRLSDAIKNRDVIQGIILGSAVNQDGASGGLTIPSGPSQEKVIRQALLSSNIKPEDVDYVEAHGTGTSLGDPIEINALGEVFRDRNISLPLKVGSVKTNIGHLEACSGLASIIKVVLAMQHNLLPASLHLNKPNSRIAWNELPIEVVKKNVPWLKSDKKRIAGVSSFGFSGTNAHVILSEGPEILCDSQEKKSSCGTVLTLSAKNRYSLLANIQNLALFLEKTNFAIDDICFSSNIGRSHYKERLAVTPKHKEDALEMLKESINYLNNKPYKEGSFYIASMSDIEMKVAFYFPSLSRINQNFCIEMYKHFEWSPYFQSVLAKCKDILITSSWVTEQQWNELFSLEKNIKANVLILVTSSIIYSITKLINYIGIKPKIVLGNQIGEYIAAAIAGLFSLEDMLYLVNQSVITQDNFSNTLKKVKFKEALSVEFQGSLLNPHKVNTYDYWNFHFEQLGKSETYNSENIEKYDCVLVIGYLITNEQKGIKNFTLISDNSKRSNFLPDILAYFYSQGTDLMWDRYHQGTNNKKINLPTYAWNKSKYMISHNNNQKQDSNGYSIVQAKTISSTTGIITFDCRISLEQFSYIKDHKVFGKVVFPESTYLEMLIEASTLLFTKKNSFVIENIALLKPFIFSEKDFVNMQLLCTPKSSQSYEIELVSLGENSNQKDIHVKGKVTQVESILETSEKEFAEFQSSFMSQPQVNLESYYQAFSDTGVEYGPTFRSISKAYLFSDKSKALALIESKVNIGICCFNPMIIDGCLQLISALLEQTNNQGTYFIMSIESIQYYGSATDQLWCYIEKYEDSHFPVFNLRLFNNNGTLVGKINKLQINYGDKNALFLNKTQNWFYNISWNESTANFTNLDSRGTWLILSENDFLVQEIKNYLLNNNKKCIDIEYSNCKDVLTKVEGPIDGVIFAKGSNIELNDGINNASLELCLELLHLVQSLQGINTRLCVITQCVHNDNEVKPQQSVLWGMGRVILLERPELNPIFIDYDYIVDGLSKRVLLDIMYDNNENQVLYKKGLRYTPRLRYENVIQQTQNTNYNVNPNYAYLITGAFGALGIKVSQLLVERGAKHLVLISRQGAVTEYTKSIVESFKKQGVKVDELKVDISNNEIEQLDIPLKGVIHTAGVLDDKLLYNQTRSSFEKVLAPKIQGTWNLHKLTKDRELDFFVCFSSMTSVIGAVGQANYAAANYFMDMFCHYRRSKNLPATSISWGPWSGAGMGAREELIKHWSTIGIGTIDLDEGVLIFEKLLNSNYPHIGVMPTDWSKYPDNSSFFQTLKKVKNEEEESIVLLELRKADPLQRRKMLVNYVESEICEVLGYEKGKQSFEEDQGFFELGMNSLTAIEFKTKLQDTLDCQLSSTLTFDYPTIAKLVNYLDSTIVSVDQDQEDISSEEIEEENDDIIKKLSEQLGL